MKCTVLSFLSPELKKLYVTIEVRTIARIRYGITNASDWFECRIITDVK